MSIQLTHPTAGPALSPVSISLPDDLVWADEFAWQQVEQTAQYSTTGALILDSWQKQAGRPITLEGGVDYAWCQRSVLSTLNSWAGIPGLVMTLAHNGVSRSVVFDHASGPISATPIVPYSDPLPGDHYSLVIKFLIL